MTWKIKNGKTIIGDKCEEKSVYFSDGKITAVTADELPFDKELDACGSYVSAGLIDIHTHGGGGFDFADGEISDVEGAVRLHLKHGTTSIFPTITTGAPDVTSKAVNTVKKVMDRKNTGLPNILGIHMEGPYFSQNQRGAQNPKYITPPDKAQYTELAKLGVIKRWSFAPELEGSVEFCNFLTSHNIVASMGHSDATYEDVLKIYNCGCRLVTHFYSGMSTITRHSGFRKLGLIESAYLLEDLCVEVIADGCHLPPELLRLIIKGKGLENICLVTDSMRAAGSSGGTSVIGDKIGGLPCIIEDGVAKLPDRSAFAGSIATADRLVRVMHKEVGLGIAESVRLITENPARYMKLHDKGRIEKGYDADIVIFDENINVKNVFVKGELSV